jgi:hypothetical protein
MMIPLSYRPTARRNCVDIVIGIEDSPTAESVKPVRPSSGAVIGTDDRILGSDRCGFR